MVTIGMVCWPSTSGKEVGERFLKLPPLPSYITRKGPYIGLDLEAGIKSLSIFEYDPSKMAEAVEWISNYYAHFIGVPGLTYSVAIWFETKEALKMIGMG